MNKHIDVVVGDRGGYNAVEPVIKLAAQEGCSFNAFLSATCAKQFDEGSLKLPFTEKVREPDLLLVGASQSEEGTKAAVDMINNIRLPVLAVQDMYGSFVPTLQRLTRDACSRLIMCVTDAHSRFALLETPPRTYRRRAVVTGGPHFDKVADMRQNWSEQRQKLRTALGLSDETPVFLVVGQLNGTLEAIVTVLHAVSLAGLETDFRIICRTHPRSTKLDRGLLNAACGYDFQHPVNMSDPFSRKMFKRVRREFCDPGSELAKTSEDLLPAVDFVLSGYSTTNLYGILCGMPGVVYLGTPALRGDLYREKKLERPPEVDAGAAWYAETPEELADIVREIGLLIDQPSERLKQIMANQAKMAEANDGHAAERVWAEAKKLLS